MTSASVYARPSSPRRPHTVPLHTGGTHMAENEGGLRRREVVTAIGALGFTAFGGAALAQPAITTPDAKKPATAALPGWDAAKGEYVLPPLPYPKEALEPHIDAQTMEVHHDKHHAAYVSGLNKALSELAKIRDGQGDPSLIKHWSREVSFHGSGHANHTLFWQMMAPAGKGGGAQPTG